MKVFRISIISGLCLVICVGGLVLKADNWTAWRGSNGDGFVREASFPTAWSAEKNVLWKADLPAPRNSSAIVYENRVFVSCASRDATLRSLLAFDRGTGELLWDRSVAYEKHDPTHATNPWCAATPASDGENASLSGTVQRARQPMTLMGNSSGTVTWVNLSISGDMVRATHL